MIVSVGLSLGLVLTLIRWGLFASIVTFFTYLTSSALLMTLDSTRLYFAPSAWLLALLAAMAVIGYRWARADEPLFGSREGFG
jgi:hypothetical protein